jgi:hypothetical protein
VSATPSAPTAATMPGGPATAPGPFQRYRIVDGCLAPRTIRHIYFLAHTMFKKAVKRELLLGNPCTVEKDDLPAKVDMDPEWRARAIHTRTNWSG